MHATPRLHLAALAVLALLFVASVVPSPYAQAWPDSVRDVAASLALARGERFPLVGPQINLGPHIGPAWIWLQAPALLVSPSFAAASIYIALVAGLKFFLLYALGRSLAGPRLGLCFAVGAALPSIAAYQWHVFWHPNWVEAAILSSLLLLVRAWRAHSLRALYAGMLVLGLAIQLHPTALFYAPLFALVLLRNGTRGSRLALHLAGFAGMVAVWFVPLLFATDQPHKANMEVGVARVALGLGSFTPGEIVTVLRSAYVDVPLAIGATYAARLGVGIGAWLALLALCFAPVVAGLVAEIATNRQGRRAPILTLVAAILIGWTIVTSMRTFTSFYLGYFLLPLLAVSAGYGLDRLLAHDGAALRWIGVAALVAVCATYLISSAGARMVAREGYIETPLPLLMDLKHPTAGAAKARWIGASHRDAMARFACRDRGMVTLHGDWGYTIAASTGLDFRLHCPAHEGNVRLLGAPGERTAWSLLTDVEATRLGRRPSRHFGGLAAFPVKARLGPASEREIQRDWYYFEQLRDRRPLTKVSIAFETAPADLVMIHRWKPFAESFGNLAVLRDGVPATPAASTYNSDVYASPTTLGPTKWRIEFDTDAPQWTDVHVF